MKVFTVLYHVEDDHPMAGGGPAGDGSFTYRSRSKADAEAFAKGKDYYGRPAKVDEDDVPRRLASRWGCC